MPRFSWSAPITAVSVAALMTGIAFASPPPADTVIGNQAAATYVSDGEEITVQSNIVETIVNEVFGLELDTSQTRSAAPGGFVFFPHALNNNSNTDDTFNLSIDTTANPDTVALTDILIFADADQDGVPDNLTPITVTPSILAGETFGIVVRATVPASANSSQSSDFDIIASSVGSLQDGNSATNVTVLNTDTVNITTEGIIDLQKDQVLENDADGNGVFSVGDTVRVNLTYSNTGIADATNVVIADTLPNANLDNASIELNYVLSSGQWSDAPGAALTDADTDVDASNAQGANLNYDFDGTLTVSGTLDVVPAGRSGTLSFDYVISDAPRGIFENTASVQTSTQTETFSNGSPVDIAPAARIIVADAEGTDEVGGDIIVDGDEDGNLNTNNFSTTDTGAAGDDIIVDDSTIFGGGTLAFDVVLTNLGNDTDTFDLTIDNTDFPLGTLFDIVAEDGVTPIIGQSVTLASGEARHVQITARLPADTPATPAQAGFDAVITATSQADPNVSNTTTASFEGAVEVATLDLVNTDGTNPTGGVGNGNTDDGGDPFETLTTGPGEQVTFNLQIGLQAGQPSNSFDLGTGPLPEGWVVEFFLPDGAPIQNTGALIPTADTGAQLDYVAIVTIPEGAPPATEEFLFTATSPSNGASDSILNAVTVNEVVDLSIAANSDVQAAPGGVAIIAHTITNLGNSTVTAAALSLGGVDSFADQGLTATLFYDADDNGTFDATDPLISNISDIASGLAAGEAARVFIRVQVPATSGLGLLETGDLAIGGAINTSIGTATDADLSNNSVQDSVAIISGDITLVKEQALDLTCNGETDSAFTRARQNADPGQCIVYRLQADNTGTSLATDVVLRDTVPDFSTFETCTGDCAPTLDVDGAQAAVAQSPQDGSSGVVATSSAGSGFTMNPGARAVLTFTVQIDE